MMYKKHFAKMETVETLQGQVNLMQTHLVDRLKKIESRIMDMEKGILYLEYQTKEVSHSFGVVNEKRGK